MEPSSFLRGTFQIKRNRRLTQYIGRFKIRTWEHFLPLSRNIPDKESAFSPNSNITFANGDNGGLHARGHVHFLEDLFQVFFDGFATDAQA